MKLNDKIKSLEIKLINLFSIYIICGKHWADVSDKTIVNLTKNAHVKLFRNTKNDSKYVKNSVTLDVDVHHDPRLQSSLDVFNLAKNIENHVVGGKYINSFYSSGEMRVIIKYHGTTFHLIIK